MLECGFFTIQLTFVYQSCEFSTHPVGVSEICVRVGVLGVLRGVSDVKFS